jgi:hypothetical protein
MCSHWSSSALVLVPLTGSVSAGAEAARQMNRPSAATQVARHRECRLNRFTLRKSHREPGSGKPAPAGWLPVNGML